MNWAPTEMQAAIRELSREILTKSEDPWASLAEAGLLDLDDPLDVATLLVEAGRACSDLPLFEHLVLGGPGEGSRRSGTLTPVELRERRLFGQLDCVPSAGATHLVVSAAGALHEVDLDRCVRLEQTATDGQVLEIVQLEGIEGRPLEKPVSRWALEVQVGRAALQLGLAKAALRMTSAYVSKREQFARPLATFQAVSQRAADAWIDTQAMEVTLWQAAWRLSAGRPCEREVGIAAYWAAEGGHRVLSAAQHLHGGMGFDRDYPLHRFYLRTKRLEFLYGSASEALERLAVAERLPG